MCATTMIKDLKRELAFRECIADLIKANLTDWNIKDSQITLIWIKKKLKDMQA